MLRSVVLCFHLLILVFRGSLFAQPSSTGTITGRVMARTTLEMLGFVNVRIDGTSLGSVTNDSGEFVISSVPVGSRTLFVSRLGYVLASRSVLVDTSNNQVVEFFLEPKAIEVPLTDITADASEWKSNYTEFVTLLLGNTPNGRQCKILNPEIIDLKTWVDGSFHANSSRPIQVENRALGYVVDVSIGKFERSDNRLTTLLRTSFKELVAPDEETARDWKDERRRAYFGSQRHFFRSLVKRDLEEAGFVVFSLSSIDRPDVMRRHLNNPSIVRPGPSAHQRTVMLSRYLEIEYSRAELPEEFNLRRRSGTMHQVSWLESHSLYVTINADGTIDEYMPFVTLGYWAWVRLGEQLPADYEPESSPPDTGGAP